MPTEDDAHLHLLAGRFRWITRVVAPDAPGFVFFGGEVHATDFGLTGYEAAASLSGKGMSASEAFTGCVGEGVEHLSRLEWGNERFSRRTFRTADHGLDEKSVHEIARLAGYDPDGDTPELDWMQGLRLSDGRPVLLPAAICIRRPNHRQVVPIPSAVSTGCAAGPTLEAATLSALLELIERDAVALWWTGGRRGGALGLDTLTRAQVADLNHCLREENNSRITWLLNLTSDVKIPCVAALSASMEGRGFACGIAARLDVKGAIRAAMLELCQSELGHHLVAAKRKVRGDSALNEADRRKLERGHNLDARSYELLYPAGFPEDILTTKPGEASDGIRIIVEHLQRIQVEPLLVDLTRSELHLPAVRVVAPGLQPFPSSLTTDRLKRVMTHLGSRAAKPVGMPLY
jgi:ribosomal protein S12 methylthiotransferase accessory factor